MSVEYFLDTNVLLYRYSDQDIPDKRRIAANLLESGRAIAGAQVLNELCNVIRKKFPTSYTKIESTLTEIRGRLPIMPPAWEDPPVETVPDWDTLGPPPPEYVFDQRVPW